MQHTQRLRSFRPERHHHYYYAVDGKANQAKQERVKSHCTCIEFGDWLVNFKYDSSSPEQIHLQFIRSHCNLINTGSLASSSSSRIAPSYHFQKPCNLITQLKERLRPAKILLISPTPLLSLRQLSEVSHSLPHKLINQPLRSFWRRPHHQRGKRAQSRTVAKSEDEIEQRSYNFIASSISLKFRSLIAHHNLSIHPSVTFPISKQGLTQCPSCNAMMS